MYHYLVGKVSILKDSMTRFLRSSLYSTFRRIQIHNRQLFKTAQPRHPSLTTSTMDCHQLLNTEPAAERFVKATGVDSSTSNPNVVVTEDGTQLRISEVDGVNELRSDHESEGIEGRRKLLDELDKDVMVLTCESSVEGGSCVVYVIGTAHVSDESCRKVKEVVSYLKPQVVFLELCNSRVSILAHQQNIKVPTVKEMFISLKKKENPFGIIYSWFLAKVANKLEVFPGAEFRVAFDEAIKYGGKVVLGDRPIQITLRRTWAKLPLWHKMKLFCSLFFQSMILPSATDLSRMLKEMNDTDSLTLEVQVMSKQFPTLIETLIHERDQYMSSALQRVASKSSSVVAVVGKGHLQGIKDNWQKPIDLAKLMEMPLRKPRITVKKLVGVSAVGVAVAVAVGAVVGGYFLSRKK